MMPPPSPAVTERVNNPECRVAILSLDQLRVWVPQILLVAVDEVSTRALFAAAQNVVIGP